MVVSYDEKNPIGEGTHLIIVDGIIGQILANRDMKGRMKNLFVEFMRKIDPAKPEDHDEIYQDLVFQAEADAELEWDPIARAKIDLEYRLFREGLIGSHSFNCKWFYEPPLPGLPSGGFFAPGYAEAARARSEAMQGLVWVGCKATIQTPAISVTQTVQMRNIQHAGVQPIELTKNMALLLACKEVERLAS